MSNIRRSIKEFLGKKQWPRKVDLKPQNRDEFFLSLLINTDDVIFDLGANHGDLSEFMAWVCGVNGKVVAFEPVWKTYERLSIRLQTSFFLRAPIITLPLGLSKSCEVVDIHLPDGQEAYATLAAVEQVEKLHQPTHTKTLHCGVITLDLFMQTSQVQYPDVVKIDVEGAEYDVMMGGRSVFEHAEKPILFTEVVGSWLANFGATPWDLLGYLQDQGYRHLFMCPERLVEHESTSAHPFPVEFRMGYNVISYVPDQHRDRRARLEPYLAPNVPGLPPMFPPTIPNEV